LRDEEATNDGAMGDQPSPPSRGMIHRVRWLAHIAQLAAAARKTARSRYLADIGGRRTKK
jgi:hypothetical protein